MVFSLKKLNIKIDFCYIDGSHYYEGIKNDYNNFNSILRKDKSYVAFVETIMSLT